MKHTVILIILDGFGIGEKNQSNPIEVAHMPTFNSLNIAYPNCSLQASGIAVGLPWNEEGNSEVGHLTIGSGRIIYQHFPKITLSIQDNSFFSNPAILGVFDHAKKFNSDIHIAGLLSEANVHSSYSHLLSILKIAKDFYINNPGIASRLFFHLFSDGRDSPPQDGLKMAQKFKDALKEAGVGEIATVAGRHYGMNRDKQWDRTELVYKLWTEPSSDEGFELEKIYEKYYEKRVSDEFIEPITVEGPTKKSGMPLIKNNDAIFFFNFREDSMRQIFQAFADKNFDKFERKSINNLHIATMTQYLKKIDAPVAFPPEKIKNTLGEIISQNNLTQLRVAESEKYAHLTFFFDAYKETPFIGEQRILIPSLHPPSIILERPEMRSNEIADRVILALQDQAYDFIAANFANPDVIGHTANWDAAIKTLEALDSCIKRVLDEGLKYGADIVITADHGNIERIMNPRTGEPETQHDTSLVPFYLVSPRFKRKTSYSQFGIMEKKATGILSDIAPTILDLMALPQPKEMTGISLIKKMLLR